MRLPVRLRLTVAFAASMTLLLSVGGTFLYLRLGAELLHTVDATLRAEASAVASGIGQQGIAFGDHLPPGTIVQILDARGRVVEGGEASSGVPLVRPSALRSVTSSTLLERVVPHLGDQARVLVEPVREGGRRLFVVAAASLDPRRDTLRQVLLLLVVAGPLALALTSLGGWVLAGAALRPVEEMVARLQEARDREARFVAEASHELRTPLAILKAELELGLHQGRRPEEVRGALSSAAEEADRLVALADALLTMSNVQAGQMVIHREASDVRALIHASCEPYTEQAAAAGVAIRIEATNGEVWVDGQKLRQAIENLVRNALRFTPRGGVIWVRAALERSHLRISVRDTGAGFSVEMLARGFEPFARADEEGSASPGVGLGLPIAQSIAQAHGGEIRAQNLREGGALVALDIPLTAAGLSEDEKGPTTRAPDSEPVAQARGAAQTPPTVSSP